MKTHRAFAAAAFAVAIAAAPAIAQDRPMYELQPIAVEVLSESHDLHQQAVDLYEQPARWEEAARRCTRIGLALPTTAKKAKYVRMMVLPKVLWNAGWQAAPGYRMRALADQIEKFVLGFKNNACGHSRSRYLAWANVIGPHTCP